jgi:hypothetical protein
MKKRKTFFLIPSDNTVMKEATSAIHSDELCQKLDTTVGFAGFKKGSLSTPSGNLPKDQAARLRRAFKEATIRWPNSRSAGSRIEQLDRRCHATKSVV